MHLEIETKYFNPKEVIDLMMDLFAAEVAMKHIVCAKVGIMEDYVVEDLLTPELLEAYTYLRNASVGFVRAFKECEEDLAEYRKYHPEN